MTFKHDFLFFKEILISEKKPNQPPPTNFPPPQQSKKNTPTTTQAEIVTKRMLISPPNPGVGYNEVNDLEDLFLIKSLEKFAQSS